MGGALLAVERRRRKRVCRPKRGLPTTCVWQAGCGGGMAPSQRRGLTSSGRSSSPTGSLWSPSRDPTLQTSDSQTFTLSRTLFTKRSHGWKCRRAPGSLVGVGRGGSFSRLSPRVVPLPSASPRYLFRTQGLRKTQCDQHCPAGGLDSRPDPCSPGRGNPGLSPETDRPLEGSPAHGPFPREAAGSGGLRAPRKPFLVARCAGKPLDVTWPSPPRA